MERIDTDKTNFGMDVFNERLGGFHVFQMTLGGRYYGLCSYQWD